MKKIIRTFKQISILILAITLFGCCEDDNTVLPKVVASFTHTINFDTGVVTFINTSENATNYSWDFGDDTSATLINPVHVYEDGTYTVILTASNVAGASDIFEDTITINTPLPITLPITFDDPNVKYDAVAFDGTAFEVVDNPAPGGTNDKASNVGAIKNSGATFEGVFFELGTDIDLATDRTITMNFWADAPIDVLMKLEEGSSSTPDVIVSHSGSGWEALSFNFTETTKYSKLVIFVDGPGTTEGTFYMDDVIQTETPPEPCVAETEESMSASNLNITFMTDQTGNIIEDGADFEWADNPNSDNEVNNSCKVGKITKLGNNPWDNNQIILDSKLDFNANEGLKIKVFSTVAGFKVRLKLEDQTNAGINTELEVTTTKTNEWEELSFSFTGADTDKFDKIVIFFDLNANNTDTYYFDDLKLYGTGGGGSCSAETSESISASNLDITFMTDQTANVIEDGAGFEWIDNPDADNAINNSCKVGKITKLGNNPWDNNQIDLDAKLNFTSNTGLKIKVWSSRANTEVRIKLEEIGNAGNNVEKFLTTSVTNEWEELTFAFAAGDSDKFNKIVIFFDLNAENTDTYYFDDLALYGDGGGTTPPPTDCPAPPTGELLSNGDFEAGDVGCWQFFLGSSISSTINNGGSKSAEIQGTTGAAVGLKQERFAMGVVQPNTSYTVSFDIIADGAFGEGGLMKAFTFSEGADGGDVAATLHTLTDNTTSISTSWETKTYTFTTAANANQVEGGISFLIELVNSAVKLNVDNVVIKKTP